LISQPDAIAQLILEAAGQEMKPAFPGTNHQDH
jgi:hypothetical protein